MRLSRRITVVITVVQCLPPVNWSLVDQARRMEPGGAEAAAQASSPAEHLAESTYSVWPSSILAANLTIPMNGSGLRLRLHGGAPSARWWTSSEPSPVTVRLRFS
jgi:hypothetical protein